MDKIEQQLDQFISYCRHERHLSEHTCQSYQRDIHKFILHLKKSPAENKLSHFIIQQWLGESYQNGISAKSLARYLASLRSFFHYLQMNKLIVDDPTVGVKTPKVGKTLPKSLDIDQVQAVLNIPQQDPLAIRDLAIMEILYSSGLRISELVNANLEHLDLSEGLILVKGKGNKERIVPVGQVAITQLHQWFQIRNLWIKNDEPALFISQSGERLGARAIQKTTNHPRHQHNQ